MADKITAAETIRRLAVQFQHMVEAADALESMGKLEQTIKEAQSQADAARAEADAAKADLKKAKDQIKDAEARAKAIIDLASEGANKAADGIVMEAEVRAAEIVKRGQDEAAKLIAQASTEKARLSSEIGGLQRAIEAAKNELQLLGQDKEAAETALADATKKLDQAKAKVKALFE